jgi:zinc protease
VTAELQPPVEAPRPWAFPTGVRSTLGNGIELVCFDLPGQHVVSAHLVLDTPLNGEDRALEGVTTLTARALDEGTRSHPGEEFAELLETEGAGFGVEVSLSGTQAVLDVPASHLERAFELFAQTVTEPELSDADVARHVQIRLAQIEQAYANPAQAATIAFREAVFDPATRASRMSGGDRASVAAVDGAAARRRWPSAGSAAGPTTRRSGCRTRPPVRRRGGPSWSTGPAPCRPTSATAPSASTGWTRAGPRPASRRTRWAGRSCPG